MVAFIKKNPVNTTSNEGGSVFRLSAKQELIKMTLTSFLENSFYEKSEDKIKRLQEYISKVNDPEFLLKLAIFGRDYGLRTVNHIIFVEALLLMRGKEGVRPLLSAAANIFAKRPDELVEMISYYAWRTDQTFGNLVLPNALKDMVKNTIAKFDEYSLGKYKGKGKDDGLNLYDIINLVHPKRTPAIDKLMKGTLKTPVTWETELSANGNNKASWIKLMSEDKLGALAAVRNIRNMLKAGVSDNLIANYLEGVDWRKVFPFQAIQALDVLAEENMLESDDNKIVKVILKKVVDSFKNISDNYEGKVAIGVDTSGSMFGSPVSKLSRLDRARLGVYYGALLKEAFGDRADLYFWSDKCVGPIDTENKTIFDLYKIAERNSGGTTVSTLTRTIQSLKESANYVIILTDEEISDRLSNVANNKTIVWGLHDGKNSMVDDEASKITKFYGYTDIMWKIGADLGNIKKLVNEIEKVSLTEPSQSKSANTSFKNKSGISFTKKTPAINKIELSKFTTLHSFSSLMEEIEDNFDKVTLENKGASLSLFTEEFWTKFKESNIKDLELVALLRGLQIQYIKGTKNQKYLLKFSIPSSFPRTYVKELAKLRITDLMYTFSSKDLMYSAAVEITKIIETLAKVLMDKYPDYFGPATITDSCGSMRVSDEIELF